MVIHGAAGHSNDTANTQRAIAITADIRHVFTPMPRAPSFEPRPIVRGGKDTGRWRIIVPDETRKVRGRKAWREFTFSDFDEAANYGEKLRAEYFAGLVGLEVASPADAVKYQNLKMRAGRLGFDSPEELLQVVEGSAQLNPTGPTLGAVLDGYETHKQKHWTDKMLSTWNTCIRPFESLRHERAGAMSPQDWEHFFNELFARHEIATSTFNRSITFLKAAYEHSVHHQFLSVNPVTNIKRVRGDLERDPVVIKAPAIRQFLARAVDHHIETVPYWVLAFFSGARPDSEALRVRWEHVLWDRTNSVGGKGEIIIAKPKDRTERTKTTRDRYVELEPVLAAWLELFRQEEGPIAPSSVIVRASRERIASGEYDSPVDGELVPLIEWGSVNRDLTRHTYATAFSKAHAGETGQASVSSRLKDNLGHSSEATGDRYYKNPHMTIEEAKAIFEIMPTDEQKMKIAKHIGTSIPSGTKV